MKRQSLLFTIIALISFLFSKSVYAAATIDDIDWNTYATTLGDLFSNGASKSVPVYLLYVSKNGSARFVDGGGNYGMNGILTEVGMAFTIEKTTSGKSTVYHIISNINNKKYYQNQYIAGNYLSIEGNSQSYSTNVFLDRALNNDSRSNWTFEAQSASKQYKIRNATSTKYYLGYTSNIIEAVTSGSSSNWMLVTKESYLNAIKKDLTGQYINVSGLLDDPRLERNHTDQIKWVWNDANGTDHYIGMSANVGKPGTKVGTATDGLASAYGAYTAAEIGNETNKLTQTITGLSAGLYRITCQGFYYNEDGAENTCAYLFANGDKVLIKTISTDDKNSYESLRSTYYEAYRTDTYLGSEYDDSETGYYSKDNLVAGMFLAKSNPYGQDESRYVNEIFVNVGEDGKLSLGFGKDCDEGQVFVDNFKLYFCGNKELFLDATNTVESNIDMTAYPKPVRMLLRRSFVTDKWNALVLPVNLSGDQVKAAFGSDGNGKLSKLIGINAQRLSQIQFEKVDLDKEGLVAGECYIVYVTKQPDVKTGETTTYMYGNETKTAKGPIYYIKGVTQDAYESGIIEKTYKTGEDQYQLNYTGYLYRPGTITVNSGAENRPYILENGNMYHLTADYNYLYGTQWKLEDVNNEGGAKGLTFAIDGEDMGTVTAIEGITAGEGEPVSATEAVYNLNGQRVATAAQMEALPKGVYVIKGKKVLVK